MARLAGACPGPEHALLEIGGFSICLPCRVYVKCAQCLPLSDGREVGQQRPRSTRAELIMLDEVHTRVFVFVLAFASGHVWQCVVCFLPPQASLTCPSFNRTMRLRVSSGGVWVTAEEPFSWNEPLKNRKFLVEGWEKQQLVRKSGKEKNYSCLSYSFHSLMLLSGDG